MKTHKKTSYKSGWKVISADGF